jgi:hypothetical protein
VERFRKVTWGPNAGRDGGLAVCAAPQRAAAAPEARKRDVPTRSPSSTVPLAVTTGVGFCAGTPIAEPVQIARRPGAMVAKPAPITSSHGARAAG